MSQKPTRKKSSSVSARRSYSSDGKRKSKTSSTMSQMVETPAPSENFTMQEEPKPSNKKINYQEEVSFIFFNSMLGTIVDDWKNISDENADLVICGDIPEDVLMNKDFRKLDHSDLNGSKVISVEGSQVFYTKGKTSKKKKALKASKTSLVDSFPAGRQDSKTNSSDTKAKMLRRPLEKKKSAKQYKEAGTVSTTDLIENKSFISISSKNLSRDISRDSLQWILVVEDEFVMIRFKNGNVYEGPVCRKMMHGKGKFYWADGSVYEGDFQNGFITGKGFLVLPDLSYYNGEFCKGLFHGEGVFCMAGTSMIYSGQWKGGKKHGVGWLLYEPGNWYDGEWCEDKRHGVGLRQYKSGAMYEGQWVNGSKKGEGTMRWENNDFYKGEWSNDLIHGYGEYTWNAFQNDTFTFPLENIYKGSWNHGQRDGIGMMHLGLQSGSKIFGVWERNLKHGAGVIVCGNGLQVEMNPLFLCDKLANKLSFTNVCSSSDAEVCKVGADSSVEQKSSLLLIAQKINKKKPSKRLDKTTIKNINKKQGEQRHSVQEGLKKLVDGSHDSLFCNALDVAVHAAGEQMDLMYYVMFCLTKYAKLFRSFCDTIVFSKGSNDDNSSKTLESSKWNILTINSRDDTLIAPKIVIDRQPTLESSSHEVLRNNYMTVKQQQIEEKNLRNAIIVYLPRLYNLYDQYATITTMEPIKFKPIMIRLFLWQLWIDIGVRERGLSLIEVDSILTQNPANGFESVHDPFEKIYFWQFLQALLGITCHLYLNNQDVDSIMKDGILATMFKRFLDEMVFPNMGNYKGHALFEFKNLVSVKSAYGLYCSLGEPHTARAFLNNTCVKKGLQPPCYLKEFEENEKNYLDGINVVPVGGNIVYLPRDPPDIGERRDEPKEAPKNADPYYKTLMTFRSLGAEKITDCLYAVCPNIKSDGVVVNMDYPMSFLEFYEAILLCTFAVADKIRIREEVFKWKEEMRKLEEIRQKESDEITSSKTTKKAGKGKMKTK